MKITKILNHEQLKIVNPLIQELKFQDGRQSANGLAKEVKKNSEAKSDTDEYKKLTKYLAEIIYRNEWIKQRFFPSKFSPPLINKYTKDQGYGLHFDNSHMQSKYVGAVRKDFSYTLMLSSIDNYEGGELEIISNNNLKQTVKLDSGDVVIYPSTTLHSVLPIKNGKRIAYVGWFSSYIKNLEANNILNELEDFQIDLESYSLPNDLLLKISAFKNKLIHFFSE